MYSATIAADAATLCCTNSITDWINEIDRGTCHNMRRRIANLFVGHDCQLGLIDAGCWLTYSTGWISIVLIVLSHLERDHK